MWPWGGVGILTLLLSSNAGINVPPSLWKRAGGNIAVKHISWMFLAQDEGSFGSSTEEAKVSSLHLVGIINMSGIYMYIYRERKTERETSYIHIHIHIIIHTVITA